MHIINKEKSVMDFSEQKSEGWDERLKEIGVNDDACVLKVVTDGNSGDQHYYIKRCTFGHENGRLYNPNSMYNTRSSLQDRISHTGRRRYEFIKVGQEAFEMYKTFLKARNENTLLSAERIVNNA